MDDLIGQKFGEWTVISFDKKVKYQKYYNCKCSCGVERSVAKSNLVSNKSTSCGHTKQIPKNDLTGRRFGRLIVVSYVDHNPKDVTSRGCRWLCKCDCGNEIVTRTQDLTRQQVKSCGCLNRDMRKIIGHNNMEDLSGKQFGELTVLSNYPTNNQRAAWTCQCSCGEVVIVSAGHLKSGHTQSCGHIQSKGEERIANLLRKHDIPYKRQYTFDDLKSDSGYPLRFDFAILKDGEVQKLIEYQGKQHYEPIEYFGGEEAFNILIKNDTKKVEYAQMHNIDIVLIDKPYDQIDITDLKI